LITQQNESLGDDRHVIYFGRYCGFNDVLCQIWISYKYAQALKGTLWIDTRCAGLADDLAYYMYPHDGVWANSSKVRFGISSEDYEKLNRLSCYPNVLSGSLDQLGHYFMSSPLARGFAEDMNPFLRILNRFKYCFSPLIDLPIFRFYYFLWLNANLRFHKIDFIGKHLKKESVVLYAPPISGSESLQTLKLFRLNEYIRNQIFERLRDLPDDYDAIHIRHTDYKTNYKDYILSIRNKLIGRTVLVCSDNADVIIFAKQNLMCSKIISVTNYDELSIDSCSFRPAHYQWHLPLDIRRSRNISMLAELVGLSKSARFFYTTVEKDGFEGHSGFSKLAEGLRKNPDILNKWLGLK
jgi:hypothetical protein